MQIQPAIGAEEIIGFCGGLDWVLKAVGCKLDACVIRSKEYVTQTPGLHMEQGQGRVMKSITMDLAKYEDVVAPIRNQKRLGLRLLSEGSCIPHQVLALSRCMVFP